MKTKKTISKQKIITGRERIEKCDHEVKPLLERSSTKRIKPGNYLMPGSNYYSKAMSNNNFKTVHLPVDKLKVISCSCGCITFNERKTIKLVPAMLSPTGKKELLIIPVFVCSDCGKVIDALNETAENGNYYDTKSTGN
jgi:hypothetical protein